MLLSYLRGFLVLWIGAKVATFGSLLADAAAALVSMSVLPCRDPTKNVFTIFFCWMILG